MRQDCFEDAVLAEVRQTILLVEHYFFVRSAGDHACLPYAVPGKVS